MGLFAVLAIGAGVVVQLLHRISRLKKENQRLAARSLEVDQMKKDFISHVSHELKAPLASMQETTHLMLERIPGALTEKQKRLLELNLQSGKRLAQMIGNILDLSRLQAGTVDYDMQPCDVADLIHNVVLELNGVARDKSLRLLMDIQHEPLLVECDPNRMVQLFTNLLENALRFSCKGGIVGVHVRSLKQLPSQMPAAAKSRFGRRQPKEGFAIITIADSGPGVDDAHKESIFHTFHHGSHGKKSPGESLGLGLAICRAVVEAHRGTIWVEDNLPAGSIFVVLLPRAAAHEASYAQAS